MSDEPVLSRPAEILLVEDNDNDAELTRIGFEQSKLLVNLHRVRNGEACMAFLRKEEAYATVPVPDLILLDLNMPRMDGREVLAEVAADARLRHLPIVVLTTSAAEQDILAAYTLGCRSYILKPLSFEQLAAAIRSIVDYWFTVVTLPSVQRWEQRHAVEAQKPRAVDA